MPYPLPGIIATPSLFVAETPPGAEGLFRDACVMWWSSCALVQVIAAPDRVFAAFKCARGAEEAFVYADVPPPFSGGPVPLEDSAGVVWGWVLTGDAPETTVSMTGNWPLSPFVLVPSENPGDTQPVVSDVLVGEGLEVSVDNKNNRITLGFPEPSERPGGPKTEEPPLGEKGAGVYRIDGASGPEVFLSLEDGAVWEEGSLLTLVPDFQVVVTDGGTETAHRYVLDSVERGEGEDVYVFVSDTAEEELRVADGDPALNGASVDWDGLVGREGEIIEGEGISVVVSQVWRGCGAYDPLVDGLVCSSEDGSAVPYPLDFAVCKGESCPPVWES